MNNFEKFKAMSMDELIQWMSKHPSEDSPWAIWWNNTYCDKCEPIMLTQDEAEEKLGFRPFGHITRCSYCELNDYKCRYFDKALSGEDVAKMWLEAEVE